MNKLYPSRINWHNEPSTETPIDEINLNKMDKFCDDIDDRVIEIDSRVADIEDIEPTVLGYVTRAENAAKDSEAYAVGKRNGSDVPSTDPTYHNNAKYYSELAATSVTDAAGYASDASDSATAASGSVTAAQGKVEDAQAWANGKRGSSDVPSTDPAYHNNSKYWAEQAQTIADGEIEEAEAWAIGERNGQPVPSTDPTYHNNAKYWAEQASQAAGGGVTSFNGRSGVVDPTKGDYNIGQISPTTGARKGQIPSVDANGDFTLIDKLQSLTGTLLSSGWTLSTDVYIQSVSFTGVSSDTVGVVGLALNITEEAREAASAIGLRLRSQGTNTLTFQATDIPDQNIPVVLNF